MHKLARLDHRYVWHPFTQMRDWLAREPIVLVAGRGAVLRDVRGREYLDANASIWTNLHGHNHPRINAAIRRQLGKVAHSSALGFANEPASLLAARLVAAANRPYAECEMRSADSSMAARPKAVAQEAGRQSPLSRVFFSDDGSTAMEVALKLAYEFARRTGRSRRPRFLSLASAYHGDTVGAVSLGHIDLFHRAYAGLLFKSDTVMAPYCYRCPFNRAKPERADARDYRRCNWECVAKVEQQFTAQQRRGDPYAALVVEPLVQGAGGMIAQPAGWLRQVVQIARGHGAQFIADEVMTGFGRTGTSKSEVRSAKSEILFACQHEGVLPDFLAVAKGLTGGYLPMAATLTTPAVFDAFLGDYAEFKTFFHGHSFTANQLGAAAALASLDLLHSAASAQARRRLEAALAPALSKLWPLPNVGDIRRVGLVAGIELVKDWRTREPFDLRDRVGIRVCEAMARRGVLTRPIGNVIVLMPPYCATPAQADRMVEVLRRGIVEVLGRRR
ncbi:MAG: aminotransferase class III-fold pyridoxal phosphate-dependent enzyme [Verrucomicrobia bacterium]|nr:aminotransferase class III-fold pyridoxal phosphate-dependent enzyme [Verrucomicrobiota bacterium]